MTLATFHRALLTSLLALVLLSGCVYKNHMKRGDTLYAQGAYEASLDEYEAALARRPKSEDALVASQAARRALIESLTVEARALLDEQDYPAALNAAFALENRLPDSPEVLRLIAEVSERMQAEAADRIAREQWAGALDLLLMTYDAFPEDQSKLDPEIQRVKEIWTEALTVAARAAEEQEHWGEALLLHAQASLLTMRPENVSKRDELRARLLAESYFPVAVRAEGGRGARVVDALLKGSQRSQNFSFMPHSAAAATGAKTGPSRTCRRDPHRRDRRTKA